MILWYERQMFLKLQVLRDYEFNVWDGKIVLTVKKLVKFVGVHM